MTIIALKLLYPHRVVVYDCEGYRCALRQTLNSTAIFGMDSPHEYTYLRILTYFLS